MVIGDRCNHFPKVDRQNGREGALVIVDVYHARTCTGDRVDEILSVELRARARARGGGILLVHRSEFAEMSYLSVSFVA